jgi:hypothetical protein
MSFDLELELPIIIVAEYSLTTDFPNSWGNFDVLKKSGSIWYQFVHV